MTAVEPVVRAVGDRACIVDLPNLGRVLGVAAHVRSLVAAGALDGVVDVVPAARSVLVRCAHRRAVRRVIAALRGMPEETRASDTGTRSVTIDVVYDGADLAAVSEATGLSVAGVIAAHTGRPWQAAFGGFAPGFCYLSGGDERLDVARLDAPRSVVPAGAVAVAGGFSAVYPSASPGGWRLLGQTEQLMWDASRPQPALLVPGDTVRFRSVRERVALAAGAAGALEADGATRAAGMPGPDATGAGVRRIGEPVLTVVDTGLQALVQDGGRPGHADIGVTGSGALDRAALRRANHAVGNPPEAAGIEHLGGGLVVEAERDVVVAVSGAVAELRVEPAAASSGGPRPSRRAGRDEAVRLAQGERLRIEPPARGLRCYIAVRGGVGGSRVLGSVAYDSLSRLGSAPLRTGDRIGLAGPEADFDGAAAEQRGAHADGARGRAPGGTAAAEPAAEPSGHTVLRYVPGPRADWFGGDAQRSFASQSWIVTPRSDRVGVRLDGEPLERARDGELASEGMVSGSVQVPPDGRPVLLLADHPVTGGYPVIGTVVDADLDRAAQMRPGDTVGFAPVDPDDIGEPRAAEAAPPETIAFSIEVEGRRYSAVVPRELAAALDRARAAGDDRVAADVLAALAAEALR